MYYNAELQRLSKMYGLKASLLERMCVNDRRVKLLIKLLDNFNIPMSRYV